MAHQRSGVVRVAERAGVSIASVSRVLNDLPASPETVERVRAAAAELGYVPHATARSLKVGRTDQIALAVADVGNPVYAEMMRSITVGLDGTGYRLLLASTGSEADAQIDLLTSLNRGYADGLILIPLRVTGDLMEAIRHSRIPLVVIGSIPDDLPVDNVRADSRSGVRLAVEHLRATGHRSLGFINGPRDTVPGEARGSGYENAVAEFGIESVAVVEAGDFTFPDGLAAARELLESGHRPDAIVCANDLLALGAIKAITDLGLRVPADISVIGMDDSDIALLANPALTSVDLGAHERARVAADMLLGRLVDADRPPRRVVVEPSLVLRDSTRAGGTR
ncbi:MAG TPA: LacI family DNA-binding transcriptional regulator [Pseudolysinimonas sp.]|nr:LacI family DNA-binding transcriptional regulator [Pseudolysinimonas sp.]